MKNFNSASNISSNSHCFHITPERQASMVNRIEMILGRGNNVEIKRRSDGKIYVMEVKVTKYEV